MPAPPQRRRPPPNHTRHLPHKGSLHFTNHDLISATASCYDSFKMDIARLFDDEETADFELELVEDEEISCDKQVNQKDAANAAESSAAAATPETGESPVTKPAVDAPSAATATAGKKTTVYHLHSLIVARHSPVLREKIEALFQSGASSSSTDSKNAKPRLSMNDLKIPAIYFKPILKYMYTGNMRIPAPGQELQFYAVAKRLKVEGLCKALLAYMGTYFTVTDACLILEKALKQGHHKLFEICTYLIELHASTIFEEDKARSLYLGWDVKTFQHFLICGKVAVEETDLFEAAKRYALHNAERYNTTPKELFQTYFDEYIRYGLIPADDLCLQVLKVGWTKRQHIVEAFRYHAVGIENRNILQKSYPRCCIREARVGVRQLFDESVNTPSLTVSDNGYTVTSTHSSSFHNIRTQKYWNTPGIYYIEFKLVNSSSPSNIFFGITNPRNMLTTGYASQNADSWQLYSYNGHLYNRASSKAYAPKPNVGDHIGVYLDARQPTDGKLYFFKNRKCLGLATRKVCLPQVPCVSLYALKDEVTIVKNAKRPPRPA